ncbi:MAG: hypothetical protein ACJ76I_03725 [Gaiellaceae bacterium]
MTAQHRVPTAALVALIAGIGLALSFGAWTGPVRWTPDALFYEAQSREIAGADARTARHHVFSGPIGRSVFHAADRVGDPRWVEYAAPFYRRRWVAPIAAATLRPAFGARSLTAVSVLGYVLCGLAAFLVLRRRFGSVTAFATALAVLAFDPLRAWSAYPLSDSLGVATLFMAIYAGCRAQTGSRWRIAVWAAAVCLLAFTRDVAAIPALAAVVFALTARTRRALAVAASGAVATLVPALLFGAPLRSTMAFTFSENTVPAHDTWGFVLHRYGHYVWSMIYTDFPVLDCLPLVAASLGALALLALPAGTRRSARVRRRFAAALVIAIGLDLVLYDRLQIYGMPLPPGVMLLIGLVPLFVPAGPPDTLVRFARGGAIAALAYLLVLPEYTDLRLGLVLLPFAAVGTARAIAWWTSLGAVPAPADDRPPYRGRAYAALG